MIDPIAAASAADGARLSQSVTPSSKSTRGGASFAGELARYAASSTAPPATTPATAPTATTPSTAPTATTPATATTAPARPKSEKIEKVEGHPYALVSNGADKGLYLNQLDGNPREGEVFKLVKRDDHVFHVYGTGKDKVVVEVKSKAKADSTTAQPTGGTTPSTT